MVAQPSQSRYMTVEEWHKLEERSKMKHEYIDGQIYAMSGGSLAHSEIAINAVMALRNALRGRSCRVYNSDAAARVSAAHFLYPDATVTCDPRDHPSKDLRAIQAPRVIVEVLSNSTEVYDRGEKFGYYRECPTVQEYVLVSTRRQLVEVYHRTEQDWILHAYGPSDELQLTSIDVHFSVAMLYELTDVPEIVEITRGEV